MYTLYKAFTKDKISLAYFGIFSDNITGMLVDLSETFISKNEYLSKLSKKASMLIAESFQNIIRHGIIEKNKISELQYNKDFYHISIIEDRIVITSANVVETTNVEKLNDMVEHINKLDKDELREFRKKVLEFGEMSEKGGAGLGLIEMVRKSGLPLKKEFVPLTEGFNLMFLGLEIPIEKEVAEHKVDIKQTEKLYRHLVEDDILMLYKGDFSSSSNSNLIEMLNSNFLKNGEIDPAKLKNIVTIIEVMQNVSKHGKIIDGLREGIFAIKILNGALFIECANFVNQEDYKKLKATLKQLKASSLDELEKLYKQQMANSYLSDDDKGGLGLIELARFTHNTFTYNFVETSENEIFYSIRLKPQ